MKSEQCYKCKNFDRYYTKGVKQFDKTKCGWCCKKQDIVTIHDFCENYILEHKSNKIIGRTNYYLDVLLTEITAIRAVIEGAYDENE